jgi:hypothetical protein
MNLFHGWRMFKDVKMTIYDYEMLILMKIRSDQEFHYNKYHWYVKNESFTIDVLPRNLFNGNVIQYLS